MASPAYVGHIQPDFVRERFQRALSTYVGRGRPYTQELLSERTGIPVSTMADHLAGKTTPSLHALIAYMRELPEAFSSAILEQANLFAVRLPDSAPTDGELLRASASFNSDVCEAMADGRIDHREGAELAPKAFNVASMNAAFAAKVRAK